MCRFGGGGRDCNFACSFVIDSRSRGYFTGCWLNGIDGQFPSRGVLANEMSTSPLAVERTLECFQYWISVFDPFNNRFLDLDLYVVVDVFNFSKVAQDIIKCVGGGGASDRVSVLTKNITCCWCQSVQYSYQVGR